MGGEARGQVRSPETRIERIGVPLLFLFATLAMTFPVCARLTTHLAGSGGDGWVYLWNHWWVAHALRTPGQSLFHTQHLYYPEGVGLYTTTLTLVNCFAGLPLQRIGGPLLASNVLFLLSFWLAGYGAYRLIRYLVGETGPAVVGGLAFAFCPYMTAHALGHFNLICVGWTPLFLLAFIRSLREPGWRQPAAATLFLVVQLYSEFILGIFAIMLALGWLGLELLQYRKAGWERGLVGRVAAIFVGAGLTLVPYFLAANQDRGVKELVSRASWFGANDQSSPLVGFFVPSVLNPIWAERVRPLTSQFSGTPADNTVYVGWIVLLLASLGLVVNRRKVTHRNAALLAVLFAAVSLGPTLHFVRAPVLNVFTLDGINITPGLPFTLFHFVPVLRQLRIPTRFIILTALMLAILLASGLAYLTSRPRLAHQPTLRLAVTCLAGLLVLVDFWVAPFQTASAQVPPIYGRLGQLPRDAAVLDLPFGIRDGLRHFGSIMEESLNYQTVHERPTLTGYISRMPDSVLKRYQSIPLLRELASRIDPGEKPSACTHSGATTADGELRDLRIGVVVLHRDKINEETQRFVREHLHEGRWQHEGNLDIYYPAWIQENAE